MLITQDQTKYRKNKTGVINDPLGQPTVPVALDFEVLRRTYVRVRTDGRTEGRTDGQTDGRTD